MRSKLTLLTTAAILALGLAVPAASAADAPGAKSDITIVGAGAGPAGAMEPGAEDPGALNRSDQDGAAPTGDPEDPVTHMAPQPDDEDQAAPSEGSLPTPRTY